MLLGRENNFLPNYFFLGRGPLVGPVCVFPGVGNELCVHSKFLWCCIVVTVVICVLVGDVFACLTKPFFVSANTMADTSSQNTSGALPFY